MLLKITKLPVIKYDVGNFNLIETEVDKSPLQL